MRFGQLMAGVGVGLVLLTGATTGRLAWQYWHEEPVGNATEASVEKPTEIPPETPNQTSSGIVKPISYSQTPAPIGAAARPEQPAQPAPITISQAENDYLYDLSQALQASEQRRLTDAERLAIGRQIAAWLQAGSDYWQVRSKFDQAYKPVIAGNYGHNRDVYIKFATERLAPAFVATLTPPPPPPRVIIKTRTEYIETPAKPEVITVTQPVPVPVPRPFPVPVPGDDPYDHDHNHGSGHGSHHDSNGHGSNAGDPEAGNWGDGSSGKPDHPHPVNPPDQQEQVPASPKPPKPQPPELPQPEQQASKPDQPGQDNRPESPADLATAN
jgi:hypothetical protein